MIGGMVPTRVADGDFYLVRVAIQDVFLGTTKDLFVFLHGKIRFEIESRHFGLVSLLLARFFNSKALRLWKDVVGKFLSKICICVDGLASSAAESLGHAKPYIGHQNVPLVIRIPKSRI